MTGSGMKCLKWRRTAIPKYIDADKLVDDLQKYHRSRKNYGKSYETINRVIYSIISKQPYADVEPVVRCRDCKYKPTAPFERGRDGNHHIYILGAYGVL